jgi:hypothetical protein
MTISRDSMQYRLQMEGRLGTNVRRAAFDRLESLWEQKVAPSLWSRDESQRSNIDLLSDEQEETRARMRDTELIKQKHNWLCRALDTLEADKDASQALAAEGIRRGDTELPASMVPPKPQSEMARQYATMQDSLWYDPHATTVEPSRLTLADKPAIVPESPRARFAAPVRAATTASRPEPLSMADIARKVLPEQLRPDSSGQIASKTVALRRPRG